MPEERSAAVAAILREVRQAAGARKPEHLSEQGPHTITTEGTQRFAGLVADRLVAEEVAVRDSENAPRSRSRSAKLAELTSRIAPAVTSVLYTVLRSAEESLTSYGESDALDVRHTTEDCYQALLAVASLSINEAAAPAVSAASLFASGSALHPSLSARSASQVREAACTAIASLSPDALFPLWIVLGGPDARARHRLLPVLDYIRDTRATPYLNRLLARCIQWPDGELTAWFVVRALEHIGDRASLPGLRAFVAQVAPSNAAYSTETVSRQQLATEVSRVILALDRRAARRNNRSLLRPAAQDVSTLLRSPTEENQPVNAADRRELLRAEGQIQPG